MKITILGGSSPFIIDFFFNFDKEFYDYDETITFKLFGRNTKALDLIKDYLKKVFKEKKYQFEIYTNLENSIIDTDIIINQIRFGGLDGRRDDELFAKKIKVIPDETLGPCGLKAALRIGPDLKKLSNVIKKYSTHKLFINMINPLSISTSILTKNGVKNCVGVCELPKVTLNQLSNRINLNNRDTIEHDYYGINHRGFLFNFRINGNPVKLKDILIKNEGDFNGISVDEIITLNAIPLKYWKVLNGQAISYVGRSSFLEELGNKIFNNIENKNKNIETLLSERSMPWYKEALIPLIKTIAYKKDQMHILNIHNNVLGYTEEIKTEISKNNFNTKRINEIPDNLEKIMKKFLKHELAILKAIEEINLDNIFFAIDSDPMMQKKDIEEKYYVSKLIINQTT